MKFISVGAYEGMLSIL